MRRKHAVGDTDMGAAELGGTAVGGALGYLLSGGTPQQRVMRGLMGAGFGGITAAGVQGLMTPPDFADLTPEEREVLEAEARRLEKKRFPYRALTLGTAGLAAAAMGSPWPLAMAAPVAVLGPAASESAALKRMATTFRAARRRRDG